MTDLRTKLQAVAVADIDQLVRKDAEYGSSWKSRGGVGAFMMLARKWDRLEPQVKKHGWDVFKAITADTREEGLLDDLGDLRRYLMLIEAEVRSNQPTKEAKAPAVTSTIRPSGFNVGNGLFLEGDEGYYNGRKVKIITVYQDGEADLECLETGVRHNGIKWRFITKEPSHVDNTGHPAPFGYPGEE